jgi:uncharacterized protein YkwD
MWDKPSELSQYKHYGFEIAAGGAGYTITPQQAMQMWKNSPLHNDVLTNQGHWEKEWKAIGVAINKSFAVAWFGQDPC